MGDFKGEVLRSDKLGLYDVNVVGGLLETGFFLDLKSRNTAASKKVQGFCLLKRPPLVLPVATFYALNVANAINLILFCLGESRVA